jgi:predicted GH43/DUF377 family glycosyl hydrolase
MEYPGMKIFNTIDLVPAAWQTLSSGEESYIFNPAITFFRDGLLMAYRVVLSDGKRRMAICRLDQQFDIVNKSVVPLSDAIHDADDWQADPRFCIVADRLYIHFNNGYRKPNRIFFLELSADTLLPLGTARPLILSGVRQLVEKNWMLFNHEEKELLAIYQISPHVVLRLSPEHADSVPCVRIHETPWDASRYSTPFGLLRGSTPPVRVGDVYYSFFHSVYAMPRLWRLLNRILHGRRARSYRYAAGFYGFSAHPPFHPVCFSPAPVLHAPPTRVSLNKQLNRFADRVVYPCGSVFLEGKWTVSFGLHDKHCCLETFIHEDLLANALCIADPMV